MPKPWTLQIHVIDAYTFQLQKPAGRTVSVRLRRLVTVAVASLSAMLFKGTGCHARAPSSQWTASQPRRLNIDVVSGRALQLESRVGKKSAADKRRNVRMNSSLQKVLSGRFNAFGHFEFETEAPAQSQASIPLVYDADTANGKRVPGGSKPFLAVTKHFDQVRQMLSRLAFGESAGDDDAHRNSANQLCMQTGPVVQKMNPAYGNDPVPVCFQFQICLLTFTLHSVFPFFLQQRVVTLSFFLSLARTRPLFLSMTRCNDPKHSAMNRKMTRFCVVQTSRVYAAT